MTSTTEIGPERPTTEFQGGRYIGPDSRLHGERALVTIEGPFIAFAQFNDIHTGFGYGWWKFPLNDWIIDEPTEDR